MMLKADGWEERQRWAGRPLVPAGDERERGTSNTEVCGALLRAALPTSVTNFSFKSLSNSDSAPTGVRVR